VENAELIFGKTPPDTSAMITDAEALSSKVEIIEKKKKTYNFRLLSRSRRDQDEVLSIALGRRKRERAVQMS